MALCQIKKAGAGFVIPYFGIRKSIHLGIDYGVFTAELIAILIALQFSIDNNKDNLNLVFCVDSNSVLQSLHMNTRGQRLNESQKAVIMDIMKSVGEIASKIWPVV